MNTFSHYILGDLILRHLWENHGVRLDRGAFLRGNMLPDFSRTYKSMPHLPSYWARYLQRELRALSKPRRGGSRFGAADSRRLGIVCHFYSDFFCRAHTAGFEGGSYDHIRYEWLLNRRLRDRLPFLKTMDIGDAAQECHDAARLSGCYDAFQRSYLGRTPSIDDDIVFSLRACLSAVSAVTQSARAGDDDAEGPALRRPVGELVSAI